MSCHSARPRYFGNVSCSLVKVKCSQIGYQNIDSLKSSNPRVNVMLIPFLRLPEETIINYHKRSAEKHVSLAQLTRWQPRHLPDQQSLSGVVAKGRNTIIAAAKQRDRTK